MEIVSFDQDMGVGVRRWNGLGKRLQVGNRLTLNKEDVRGGGTDILRPLKYTKIYDD